MEKSKGHIAFDSSGREWFDVGGEVYVGQVANPISTYGYRLGRWECSREHFALFLPRLHAQWGLHLCYDCGEQCGTIELPDDRQWVCASCATSYAHCACGRIATLDIEGAPACPACAPTLETMETIKLSTTMVLALDSFAEPGGHGWGEHAYLSRSTAKALASRGLITLSTRDLGGGRKMGWGMATDAGRAVLRQIRGR